MLIFRNDSRFVTLLAANHFPAQGFWMTDFAGLGGITLRQSTIADLKNSALHRCHLCALLFQAFTLDEARVFIQEYQPFEDQRYGLNALPDSYG